ncbi:NTP transferase domain-containing protein [Cohnella sp. GCM10020058]|uniref:nucleotidyltransferase family protein n=1 Tax=Cohnella sp. GCM10020058 TaxID=3317330 RepID=UPI0036409AFF
MGRHKLSLAFADGERLGEKGWRALRACSAVSRLIAVVRPMDPLDWLNDASGAVIVRSSASKLGISHSIRAGLRAARRHSPDAVIVALADQPFLTTLLFERLIRVFEDSPSLDYVACDYGRFSAPPAIFSPRMYDALEALEGDEGARKLMNGGTYRGIRMPVKEDRFAVDVDTPADWQAAQLEYSQSFGYSY